MTAIEGTRHLPIIAILLTATGACDLQELKDARANRASDASRPGPFDAGNRTADTGPVPDAPGSIDGASAAPGSCDPATWLATASTAHPVNPPAYAIDGLQPTRWSSGSMQRVGHYLEIDFGGAVRVSGLELEHAYDVDGLSDYPRGIEVLFSPDGLGFADRAHGESPVADPGPSLALAFAPRTARAMRLRLTADAEGAWWTIHELRADCSFADGSSTPDAGPPDRPDAGEPLLPDTDINPNRASWSASASAASATTAAAFDADPQTRWTTGNAPQYGDEWYELDLGTVAQISALWVQADGEDFPSAYRLSLSTDGIAYTAVATGLGREMIAISFARQRARYLRIDQIGSGYDRRWSIAELTVVE